MWLTFLEYRGFLQRAQKNFIDDYVLIVRGSAVRGCPGNDAWAMPVAFSVPGLSAHTHDERHLTGCSVAGAAALPSLLKQQ